MPDINLAGLAVAQTNQKEGVTMAEENKELVRRLKLAIDYGFENPEDAVTLLQFSENFDYALGVLAKSGRLPMTTGNGKEPEPPRIRL